MKPRKVPQRMCVGCREMRPKRELLRVVKSTEGALALDRTGRMPGRGAYICPREECLRRAVKTRQLERALEARMEDAVVETLRAALVDEG